MVPRASPLGSKGPAPLALFRKIGNAYSIHALCEAAEAMGLRPGVSLAEARARFPGLDFEEADLQADARLLEAVADWCDRYTPLVALDPPNGLILDISGCAHLFGGEAALLNDLLGRLSHQGFAAAGAAAPKAGTARALVLHAGGVRLEAGGEISALEPLPIAALRLAPETVALLGRLGLKRIGDLLSLPRAGLARRFGRPLMTALDEALGRIDRPITPRLPVPVLIHERRLFEPISLADDILGILRHLADRLRQDLERRGEGARHLELALFRLDGKVDRLGVRTVAPLRDPVRIKRLFAERLKAIGDELDAGFGYDLVKLAVLKTGAMREYQGDLEREEPEVERVEDLLDRLAARLGEAAVYGLDAAESHWPERAQIRREPGGSGKRTTAGEGTLPRPLRLLERPEPIDATALVPEGAPEQFRWRQAVYHVRRVEGPERIAPEWWREDNQPTRDYWRVEDEEGRRYWLFREGGYEPEKEEEEVEEPQDQDGAGETGSQATGRPSHEERPVRPAWYLHGIFA